MEVISIVSSGVADQENHISDNIMFLSHNNHLFSHKL